MGKRLNREIKDTMFSAVFSQPKYLRQLYLVIHPEDTAVTEQSFTDITIQNILTDDIYNDLGFMVNNRLIILFEAQSTWSVNIVIRSLMYLVKSYQDYIDKHKINVYSSKKIKLPKPELYVIYTGKRENKPNCLSLRKEFFDKNCCIDTKVKVIFNSRKGDIINQYKNFAVVLESQIKKYGRKLKAIEETIKICKGKNILREFLTQHENEVKTMFDTLFDQKEITKRYEAEVFNEGKTEGKISVFHDLIKQGLLTLEQAATSIGISTQELLAQFKQHNLVL